MTASGERLILGIETSCDETAASVVRGGEVVLSNVIASQHELHEEYRGVVPEIASRAHAERLLPIVRDAAGEAGISLDRIDAIAVANSPGLIGSLLIGVAGAKALALGLGVPVIGVDHVRAHLCAGCLRREGGGNEGTTQVAWPALGLIVSGGHTSMYICESITLGRKVGGTIDDAIGEAYDKVAAILELGFPGGPNIDRLACEGTAEGLSHEPDRDGFPISRIAPDSLDFSFSGLKTAALYAFKGVPETERTKAKRLARGEEPVRRWSASEVAASFQAAAVASIELKLERAINKYPACKSLLVGGGVSANSALRSMLVTFAQRHSLALRLPTMEFCMDNAAMIAAMGHAMLDERAWIGDRLTMSATPTTGS